MKLTAVWVCRWSLIPYVHLSIAGTSFSGRWVLKLRIRGTEAGESIGTSTALISPSRQLSGGGRLRPGADHDGIHYANTYNAGIVLDGQLDKEMHSAFCIVFCSCSTLRF